MTLLKKYLLLGGVIVLACAAHDARAGDGTDALSADKFQMRVRALGVITPEDSRNVSIGGEASVSNAYVPEIDLTYFPTPKIGVELIAATARHQLDYNTSTKLGDTWILPPTVTVQYHPLRGEGKFSPYLGAGLNYSLFYGDNAAPGNSNLDVKGGLGYAVQAGMDYWINDNWGVNLDVKKCG